MVKITYKGETRNIPKKYLPDSLSPTERKKQIKSIFEGKDRPDIKKTDKSGVAKRQQTRRSSWAVKFEKKYKTNIMDDKYIIKNLISKKGMEEILDKGRGAYYSSGSRPNVSAEQWARGRLASVILGGGARRVDKKIWEKYKK